MTETVYVIGDIHGHLASLEKALDWVITDGGPDAPIVFLGDYIDRGPASRQVIELLSQGQAEGRPWVTLKGNHDRYLTRFLGQPELPDPASALNLHWFNERIGGRDTLASYGVDCSASRSVADIHADALQAVPAAHHSWVAGLLNSHETDRIFFAHAGIDPAVSLDAQDEDTLLWIRKPFLNYTAPHPKLIVHGHTVLEYPQHYGNRVNLDGGGGYGRPIYPAVFEGLDCWLLSDDGRTALLP